jgi:hypothetical protein
MSQTGWYREKAAEYDRLAAAANNATTRDQYIHDRDNWLKIAASIDAADDVVASPVARAVFPNGTASDRGDKLR